MASEHEHHVIESFNALKARIANLPESETAAALRADAERAEAALRAAGYELGRPAWMRP